MPNSAIALGIQPLRVPDQAATYERALTLKALMGQGEMQDLQMGQARQKIKEDEATREAVRQSGGDFNLAVKFLLQGGHYGPAAQLQKSANETLKAGLDTEETRGKIAKQHHDRAVSIAQAVLSADEASRPGVYTQLRQWAISMGDTNAEKNLPEEWNNSLLPGFKALAVSGLTPEQAQASANYRNLAGPPTAPGTPTGAAPISPVVPALTGQSVDPVSGSLVRAPNLAQPEGSPIAAALMRPQGPQTGPGWMGQGGVMPGSQPAQAGTIQNVIRQPEQIVTAARPEITPDDYRTEARRLQALGTPQGEARAKVFLDEANRLDERVWKEREKRQAQAGAPGVTFNQDTGTYEMNGKAISAEEVQKIADRNRAAGASKQITNVNAYAPASEEAQRDFMKSTRATYDQLKQAPVALESIEKAKALIPGAKGFMGPGGESLLTAAKFLNNRLGLSIATEGVKSAEELRTRIFFNIMDNLKKMDAQPSQQQQQIMQDSLGKLGTDPNALSNVLDAFADVIRGKVALHNDEVQGAMKQGVKFPYDPTIKLNRRKGIGSGTQDDPYKLQGDDGYGVVKSGEFYTGPDGVLRRKP